MISIVSHTAYQLQFGPLIATNEMPGNITITWINSLLFSDGGSLTGSSSQISDSSEAQYDVYFHGRDKLGLLRVNISYSISASRLQSELSVDYSYSQT